MGRPEEGGVGRGGGEAGKVLRGSTCTAALAGEEGLLADPWSRQNRAGCGGM